jgi:hypothetical protein
VKQFSEFSEKEITGRIEKNCGRKLAKLWSGKDFAEVIKQTGAPSAALFTLFITIGEGRLEGMSHQMKNKFRERQKDLKLASASIRESNQKMWALMPRKPDPKSLEPLIGMGRWAASMMTHSTTMATFLKKQGQKDGVDLLVRQILDRNRSFDCWAELSRVFKGVGKHITPDALRMKRDRYLAELAMRTEKEK